MARRLGYLSAAPTVSTRPDAASAGPRSHILGVMNGFTAAGWEVLPFIVGDQMSAGLTRGGVQKMMLGSSLTRYAADAARIIMAKRSAQKAWKELGGRVDWVYERFATMQVLGHTFHRAGVPWILETQGLFYYETRVERQSIAMPELARRIEVGAYRGCDVLVCISDTLKDLLVKECGVDPTKILVVPNAVELAKFDLSLNGGKRYFEELTLCFLGGLIGWQALDFLMDAMAELRDEGIVIALAVVGDGAMQAPWQEHANKLGLTDQVRFIGRVPATDVARHIARCDLGYSGQKVMEIGKMYHSPIKLYEYMAMAKPVVASAFDDARKLVEGNDVGFLFEAGDRESLKRALREAQAQRAGLVAMGERARTLIETEHTWAVRSQHMIGDVERILKTRRRNG